MSSLDEAIQHIRMGNRDEGRQILEELLEVDEGNEDIWLWLTSVVESDEDREICLENVLAINPNNVVAQRGLDALRAGTFDAGEMLSDVLEETAEPATFIDDFLIADEEEEEELEMPRSMGGTPKKPKTKARGGINLRLIILLIVALFVVLGLGGIAAASLFLGGGDDGNPVENPVPAESVEAVSPPTEEIVPTDTPTAEATATATETPRPHLELPTAKPTDPPTPIATQVVSPTPSN
ncbi:MAG: hypothetical protein KDJ52_01235 [Anaerolineae bacterium]|nr:hypothetical protein [Anaerolineae bacterium]